MPHPGSIGVAGGNATPSADPFVDRWDDGIWRYAGTSIPAVGAQDRTLADILEVRELRIPGRLPEAVVLSLSDIVADSRLNWVLQAGTRLRGSEEDLFSVPWPVWEERASEPVDVWLPERDTDGLSRQLAIAEREVRFLREALETSTARRSQLVLLGTKLGMTRRQIAGIVGLSPGRVQQFHKEADEEQATLVQRTIDDASLLLEHAGNELYPTQMDIPPGWTREKLKDVLAHLVDFGLLEAPEDGGTAFRATEIASRLRAQPAVGSKSHSAKHEARIDA